MLVVCGFLLLQHKALRHGSMAAAFSSLLPLLSVVFFFKRTGSCRGTVAWQRGFEFTVMAVCKVLSAGGEREGRMLWL